MKPVSFAIVSLAMACSKTPTQSVNCAPLPSARFAMTIRLQDSLTKATAPFNNVDVVVVDGSYRQSVRVDTIRPMSPAVTDGIRMAPDRPGVYTAVVTADGYDAWIKTDIVGRTDPTGCGMATESLTALLRPSR